MKLFNLVALLVVLTINNVAAQGSQLNPEVADKWLVKIGDEEISAADFWYVFTKNAKEGEIVTQDSLNSYRKLYDKFLLRVQEAKSLGYDTTAKFVKEFNGYKDQLAESYLKDKSVTKKLVQEAYERSQFDVEASHILIGVGYHELPSDTTAAYKTALKVKKEADAGKDFAKLAKKYSTDPSAKDNDGYLGFFSVFKMVYPFETAAYTTPVGSVSNIFRTRFGYHIVKVHSKRKAIGEINVAHIMTRGTKDLPAAKLKAAEENINEIYEKILNGESFDILARKFSEDLNTARKGGELGWFGPNKYVPVFENAAFALDSNGAISKPIKTPYGWHIIKRLDRKELASFEEMQTSLKAKVARSDRAELSEKAVIAKIKNEYDFKEFRNGIDKFYKYCDTTLITGKWEAPADKKLKTKMFSFAGKTYTQKDFADYLTKTLVAKRGGDYRRLVTYSYDSWMVELLKNHEKSQLESKYPEYTRLLKEYKEGIILFDLTSEKVWNKSVIDTAGLRAFYETKKNEWMWDERMDGVVYKCVDKATVKKVRKYLKKGKDDVFILENINVESKLNVRVEAGVYQANDRPELKGKTFKKGISKWFESNETFYVLKVNSVLKPTPKSLNEVRGVVTAQYQDYLMATWIAELSAKYKIKYNEKVFKQLIK